jgi:hypothetical protein
MNIDPSDDCTFWYTNEYYETSSDRGWKTHIGSFTMPECGKTAKPVAHSKGTKSKGEGKSKGKSKGTKSKGESKRKGKNSKAKSKSKVAKSKGTKNQGKTKGTKSKGAKSKVATSKVYRRYWAADAATRY